MINRRHRSKGSDTPSPSDDSGIYAHVRESVRHVRRVQGVLGLLVMVAFMILTWVTYNQVTQQLRDQVAQKLEALLQANVTAVQLWLEAQRKTVEDTAKAPGIVEVTERIVDSKGEAQEKARADLDERLRPLMTPGREYALLSLDRKVLASSVARVVGETADPDALLERVIDLGSAVSGPRPRMLAHDPEEQSEVVVAAGAMVGTPPQAILVYATDVAPFVRRIRVARWGESGEVYAFDRNGVMLTPSRFGDILRRARVIPSNVESSALEMRIVSPGVDLTAGEEVSPESLENRPLTVMAAEATRGESGENVSGYRGYLGNEVVGAWTWLEEYDFGVATEVSSNDALASVAVLQRSYALLVALAAFAMLGFGLLGRWHLRLRDESSLVSQRLDRLARAIQPLSAALENEPAAVLLANQKLEVIYANPAATVFFRHTGPFVGTRVNDLFASLSPELREALLEGRDTIVSRSNDGSEETVLVTTREMNLEGKPHALYTLRPITREVRRQEVEHWKKLIRILSHELNNALAPITSLVTSAKKLAKQGDCSPQLDRALDTISDRTSHLLGFLETYRSVARLPRPSPKEVAWEPFIRGLEASANFQLDGSFPARAGYFDPAQIERVLENLLKNAVEAGSPPEETLLRVDDEEGGMRIQVLDRGSGMRKQVLEQAMLPFYSTKRSGTGVGLALSREIVEAHGGRLTLANRDGGGTVATCFLPHRSETLYGTSQ